MAMQTKVRKQIAGMVPDGARQGALTLLFHAYGRLADTRSPYDYLFLLSHMRAGSSLLAMLLGNSGEICGYGETMLPYRSAADLKLLAGNNLFRLQPFSLPGPERYMLDKLVHDDLLAPELLGELAENGVRFIFLIREPLGTINSMMTMVSLDEMIATSLYIKRLETLAQYGRALPDSSRAFFLSYDELTKRTDSTLAALSEFLDLRTPLRSQYEVLRPMQERRSAHYARLHLGRVDGEASASAPAQLSERELHIAVEAYQRCRDALAALCETAGKGDQPSVA